MPVKNKRNGASRKQRSEALPIVYSHSLLDDTPSTSGASSPADHTPLSHAALAHTAYDPGPPEEHLQVAEEVAEGNLLGSEFAERFHVEEEAPLPVPPPATIRGLPLVERKVAPESPALPPEPLVDTDVPDTPELQERGHVRSPVLAR